MRALTELVDAQAHFFQAAASHVSKLQSFVHEKNGGVSTSASFPRRNSANQSVPVSDILKVKNNYKYNNIIYNETKVQKPTHEISEPQKDSEVENFESTKKVRKIHLPENLKPSVSKAKPLSGKPNEIVKAKVRFLPSACYDLSN